MQYFPYCAGPVVCAAQSSPSLPPAQRMLPWNLQVSSGKWKLPKAQGWGRPLARAMKKADKGRAEVTHAWLITAGTQTPPESEPRFVWRLVSLHGATSDWRLSCGEKWTAVAAKELDRRGKRAVTPERSSEARWACPCSTCHQTISRPSGLDRISKYSGSQNLNVMSDTVSKCLLERKKQWQELKSSEKLSLKKKISRNSQLAVAWD